MKAPELMISLLKEMAESPTKIQSTGRSACKIKVSFCPYSLVPTFFPTKFLDAWDWIKAATQALVYGGLEHEK